MTEIPTFAEYFRATTKQGRKELLAKRFNHLPAIRRIAAYDMGFDYWGCELDIDYFNEGNKRFENFKLQQKLF